MEKFCTNCGRPLEDGQCPACNQTAAGARQTSSAPGMGGSARASRTLVSGFQSLLHSRDLFRILPAAGFALMVLLYLSEFICSLFVRTPAGLPAVLSWFWPLACAAAACGAVRSWHAADRASLLETAVLGLLGLSALLYFGGLLSNWHGSAGIADLNEITILSLFNLLSEMRSYTVYVLPSLLLLLFGLIRTEENRFWRALNLAALCIHAAVLLLSVLRLNVSHFVELPQLFSAFCVMASYVR